MQAATANPDDLRRFFHEEIDRMEPSRLEILNRLLQQLKLFELADEADRGFDVDRAAGSLTPDKVADAIRAVRREHPYK
jgi:hypothetical protein